MNSCLTSHKNFSWKTENYLAEQYIQYHFQSQLGLPYQLPDFLDKFQIKFKLCSGTTSKQKSMSLKTNPLFNLTYSFRSKTRQDLRQDLSLRLEIFPDLLWYDCYMLILCKVHNMLVGFLMSQQHASISHGLLCKESRQLHVPPY